MPHSPSPPSPPSSRSPTGTRSAPSIPSVAASLLLRALAALPLGTNRALGALVGRLLWWTNGRPRRVAETNVGLCFPALSGGERRDLVRAALVEQGRAFTEIGWCWTRPRRELEGRLVEIVGAERLAAARSGGRGTILVTPHLGAWELAQLVPGLRDGLGYFYRPPRNGAFEPLMVAGRYNLGGEPMRLDVAGIRDALKRLAAGRTVGILPDQEPERDGGVFAPFFGTPALTMTLLSRLASRSGCEVLFVFVERLAGSAGWRYHFRAPVGDVASQDPVAAAAAVNASVEDCVRVNPAQYLWSYRRFRELPEGGRRPYR